MLWHLCVCDQSCSCWSHKPGAGHLWWCCELERTPSVMNVKALRAALRVSAKLGSGSLSPSVLVVLGCIDSTLAPTNLLTCPVLLLSLCYLRALAHSLSALSPPHVSVVLPVYLLHDEKSDGNILGRVSCSRLGVTVTNLTVWQTRATLGAKL